MPLFRRNKGEKHPEAVLSPHEGPLPETVSTDTEVNEPTIVVDDKDKDKDK